MKIPLLEWAKHHYSPPPSSRIVNAWVKSGQIHPAPEKVGVRYMVDENAERIPLQPHLEKANMSARAMKIARTA